MGAKTLCALGRCIRENGFCVFYLIGLAVAVSFVTALIFDGSILAFALSLTSLVLAGTWYLRACYVGKSDPSEGYLKRKATREKA